MSAIFNIPTHKKTNKNKVKKCGICTLPFGCNWSRHWKTNHKNITPFQLIDDKPKQDIELKEQTLPLTSAETTLCSLTMLQNNQIQFTPNEFMQNEQSFNIESSLLEACLKDIGNPQKVPIH